MDQEGAGPASPFFPSSANTNVNGTIPANFFMTSAAAAAATRDIYEQWKSSTHHFSSFNNQWYRKSIEYMQDMVGTQPSKWCAGCHDHAVFFNGRFDRPIKEQIDTPEAQAGLACTSCHSITHVRSTMGQGDFEIEYPPLHDLAASENPLLRFVARPADLYRSAAASRDFLKPFHREQTPSSARRCHKVHLDVPVNGYRWFRGFNDYDNWQASGVSGQGARSFYYPTKSQKCADCHMPLVVRTIRRRRTARSESHRFAAANTALPFVNGDAVQLKAVQDFLQRRANLGRRVRAGARAGADAAAVRRSQRRREPRAASTFAVGEESMNFGAAPSFIAPPAEVIAPARQGGRVACGAAIGPRRSRRAHAKGRPLLPGRHGRRVRRLGRARSGRRDAAARCFHSGAVADDGKGPVDPGAHFYRSLLLDEHGNPINKRNAWAARSVAYVRLIPPGAADTDSLPAATIPEDAGDRDHAARRR